MVTINKRKKVLNWILMLVGIALILLGFIILFQDETDDPSILSEDNPGENYQTIKKDLDLIIEDFIAKDANLEDLNEKYNTRGLSYGNIVFAKGNLLSNTYSGEHEEDTSYCEKVINDHYEKVYQLFREKFTYKLEIDEETKLLILKAKTMYVGQYYLEFSALKEIYFEKNKIDLGRVGAFEDFEVRCLLTEKISNLTEELYENKDQYATVKIKYEYVDGTLILENYEPLALAVSSKSYMNLENDVATEKAAEKTTKNAKLIYEKIKW